MTDCELLELAAKAAGYIVDGYVSSGLWVYERNASWKEAEPPIFLWSPLKNDGDALRLAVKLNLDILQDPVSSKDNAVEVQGNFENVESQPWAWENRAPDPYTATRRAIVRVAAEIGKLTKN